MSEKNLLQPVIAFSNGSEEGAVSCPFCGGEARITYVNDAPFAGCENKSCPAHNFDAIPLAAWNKREPLRKPPAAELCPFCGSIPDRWYVEGEEEYFARCRNPKCEAAMFPGISLGAWNTRPIEDALNKRIMIDNFIKNYNRAVLDGKTSTDVKNIICWPPNPPEVK